MNIFPRKTTQNKHISFWKKILYRSPGVLQRIAWIPGYFLIKVFLRFTVKGRENIKGLRGPVILALNHSSEWDPIVALGVLSPWSSILPMFYTARERKFYAKKGIGAFFYGGTFFKMWGAYPVGVGMRDYEQSLKPHIRILEESRGSICIFPEGKKTSDGNIQEAKGGISFLLKRTGVPVIPISLQGHFAMPKTDFFLRRRKLVATVGKPIYQQDIFPDDVFITPDEHKRYAQEIMSRIARLMV